MITPTTAAFEFTTTDGCCRCSPSSSPQTTTRPVRSLAFALLAGRRPLRTAGAYVAEWGDAEWLQQSAAPRTVQHKAPLPRRGTDRGKRPACERQVESQAMPKHAIGYLTELSDGQVCWRGQRVEAWPWLKTVVQQRQVLIWY